MALFGAAAAAGSGRWRDVAGAVRARGWSRSRRGLALPGAASAHAYLVKTVPAASGVARTLRPPPSQLTYDEAVEPRFAIISVTDAAGGRRRPARSHRSPANPDTLVVPLKPAPARGLVPRLLARDLGRRPSGAGRVHVRGRARTPAPRRSSRSRGSSADRDDAAAAGRALGDVPVVMVRDRAVRAAAADRAAARPAASPGTSLRARRRSRSAIASASALIAIPVYLDFSTAIDSLRSAFAVGALVPLFRVTAFGRALRRPRDLLRALLRRRLDRALGRPARARAALDRRAARGARGADRRGGRRAGRPRRRRARRRRPRRAGCRSLLDWLHLVSGSLWLGGLVGLLVLWRALPADRRVAGAGGVRAALLERRARARCDPAGATGIGATIIHMPAVTRCGRPSYGQAILVKSGLLAGAMALGAVNLLRTKPRLVAARERPEVGEPAATPAAAAISGETVARRRRGVRGGGALEPGAAAAGVRRAELGARARSARARSPRPSPSGLSAAGAGLAEQGRRAELVRAADHQERPAGAQAPT